MKSVLIPSLVAILLSPAIAFAHDGTINFTGSITATTCTYDSPGASQTVALDTVSAAALRTSGATAADKSFNIRLINCGTTSKSVAINLEGGQFDSVSGNLRNSAPATTAAENVMVQLADSNGTAIRVPGRTATVASTTEGVAVIPLIARYVATGTAEPGTVTSSVNFSIIYP